MIHDTHSAQISQSQDERNINAIMKTMCSPGYHHNVFVATHVPKCMSCNNAIVVITGRAHCFHECIYTDTHTHTHIYIYIYIYIYSYIYIYLYIFIYIYRSVIITINNSNNEIIIINK